MTKKKKKTAAELHEHVPPDWYFRSIRENIIQRFWHNKRFQEVSKVIEPVKGAILDLGSADGVFTKVILDKSGAKKVVGIDVLHSSVGWANKHWKKNKKLKFKVGDAHKLEFVTGEFDALFALEILEHVVDPRKVLQEIKRVLKKGGYAVFLVPTDVWYFKILWDYIWTKTRGKIWDHTHLHSYTSDALVDLVKDLGFKIEESRKFLFGMLQIVKVRKR